MRLNGRTALGVIGSRRTCFVSVHSSISLSVWMRAVAPNPDSMAMIKGLAELMDQLNSKVKTVMLRVDECEKRLEAQQTLARVGGAFRSDGVRSDKNWLMDASQEMERSGLFDQVVDDRTPHLPQHIKSDMRDSMLEREETASESVTFRSVQRDTPAPEGPLYGHRTRSHQSVLSSKKMSGMSGRRRVRRSMLRRSWTARTLGSSSGERSLENCVCGKEVDQQLGFSAVIHAPWTTEDAFGRNKCQIHCSSR